MNGADGAPLVPRRLASATLVVLCLLVLAGATWLLGQVLMAVPSVTAALLAALLLAALTRPMASWLGRWLPAWLASLTTLVTGIVAVVGILALVVDRALAQTEDLQRAASQALADVEQALIRSSFPVTEGQLTDLEDRVREGLPSLLPGPAAAATGAVQVLGGLALAVFVWFFLLRDGPRWWQWVVGWVPAGRRAAVAEGGDAVWDVLTRYVRGTVVVATIDAVGVAIALLLLGVPMVTSLACLVFLGAFVPIVGSTVAGTLAVAVALVTRGPLVALLVVLAVIVVQQVEGNLLQPLVMGRALHLHPAAVVVAVAIGASAAGVIGAVVAVPLVAVVTRLAEQVRERPG
ncbi:AI-2E family transporter [Nocardioides marinus]|uniref:Putative PurR-regulated permease PerM n=1 Tax=Nocardioides marinus TaxID=374514 RepID=A0A7Y9YH99_9ACTN|nr:putative PurR-regulated permease PerM [Nocardioides marinus]